MKRTFHFFIAFFCLFALTGCSITNLGIENLMAAPRLTEEQAAIYQALIDSTGKNITLKYSRSGENRSAFLLADIDDEPTEEALVFYQLQSSDDSVVRIKFLDRNSEGEWIAFYDIAGEGTDIDKVTVTNVGDKTYVIIGFISLSLEERIVNVYEYSLGNISLVFREYYSIFDTMDIDSDKNDEMFIIKNNVEAGVNEAYLYRFAEGAISLSSYTPMAAGVIGYTAYTKGKINNTTPAIFVESTTTTGQQGTEIIYYKDGALINPMTVTTEQLFERTWRVLGYNSADLDNDSIVEIPVTSVMQGYEESEAPLYLTEWYSYDGYGGLEKEYSGYYSLRGGYAFIFPNRWKDMITVKFDTATEEVVFYRYDGVLNNNMTELMRIIYVGSTETSEYIHDGYKKIGENGQIDFLVKLVNNRREPLVLTIDEVENNFYVL